MINFMQSNQNIQDDDIHIIDDTIWHNFFNQIKNGTKLEHLSLFINELSRSYNIDKKNIIKDFINYIIRNHDNMNIPKFFDFVENIVHFEDCKNSYYVNYSLIKLSTLLKDS